MRRLLLLLLALVSVLPSTIKAEGNILNGRILTVNRKFAFVIINLGKEDGVEEGMVFMVYRDKRLLGKIKVEDVFPEMSSCVILPEWELDTLKVDDGVLAE